MRKILAFISLFLLLGVSSSFAEITIGKGNFIADIYGFARTNTFVDTRNNFESREGDFVLLPKAELLGAESNDLNENFQFNMLSFDTRLGVKFQGPKLLGAKTSALIEGEFFGTSDGDASGFRLRHAFINADWACTSVKIGQYWHPLFDVDFMPGTVSFNTGAPFQPFSRVPQLKITERFCGGISAYVAANSTRDFPSYGPSGYSNEYLRNSGVPELTAGLKYIGKHFSMGVNAECKTIQPRSEFTNLLDGLRTKTDQTVSSLAGNLYLKYVNGNFMVKAMGMYGENVNDLQMISGYAVTKRTDNTDWEFEPFSCLSSWIDMTYGTLAQFGLFAGYTKNLGTEHNTITTYFSKFYSNQYDVESAFRVAPRIVFNVGSFSIAGEIEYTAATYGTYDNTDKNSLHNKREVGNIRALLSFVLNI